MAQVATSEDRFYNSPAKTIRGNSRITNIPDNNDNGIPFIGVICTCGRKVSRTFNISNFSCRGCGRSYRWGEPQSGERFPAQ